MPTPVHNPTLALIVLFPSASDAPLTPARALKSLHVVSSYAHSVNDGRGRIGECLHVKLARPGVTAEGHPFSELVCNVQSLQGAN